MSDSAYILLESGNTISDKLILFDVRQIKLYN